MLWVYTYKYFNSFGAVPFLYVWNWRIKTVPALKGLKWKNVIILFIPYFDQLIVLKIMYSINPYPAKRLLSV